MKTTVVRVPRTLVRLEWLLLVVSLVLFAAYAAVQLRREWYQRSEAVRFEPTHEIPETIVIVPEPRPAPAAPLAIGTPIGRLEIPRLNLSVVIAEGDDNATLRLAAGHLPDTPLPWESGNSAIAAHRDALFRPLRHIRVSDRLRITTDRGVLEYAVTDTRIVMPSDLSVLAPTDGAVLTLVTCYPFNYIGAAPKRFIVRAERLPGEGGDIR